MTKTCRLHVEIDLPTRSARMEKFSAGVSTGMDNWEEETFWALLYLIVPFCPLHVMLSRRSRVDRAIHCFSLFLVSCTAVDLIILGNLVTEMM